jgi:hypothetical protein
MPAQKNGWFVRVCKTQTEASAIKLEIGLGGNSGSHRPWRTWQSNDEAEFDVPEDLRSVQEIWIKGTAIPEDRNVHMCVCFVDHVTQRMTFDADEEHETSQTDNDDCGC